MPNHDKTETLKQQWWESLRTRGASVEQLDRISPSVAHGISAADLQYLDQLDCDIRFIPGLGLVDLRICDTPPGLWHIPRDVLDRLESLKKETATAWWIVLLVARLSGEGAQGYIINDLGSQPFKNTPCADGAELQIQERRHLDSTRMVLSIEKLASILMRRRA